MLSEAERALNELGHEILDYDLGLQPEDKPDIAGLLAVQVIDADSYTADLFVRPQCSPAIRAMYAEWALERIIRFVQHGPEPDGWQKRTSDDRWQLYARIVDMPPID